MSDNGARPGNGSEPVALVSAKDSVRIESFLAEGSERRLADDVLDGLTKPFKELPPKHLYDTRGSELFEQICELPEYYPTRTELAILEAEADAIVERTGAAELLELGSGAPTKACVLMEAMQRAGTLRRYVPVDVSESALVETAETMTERFPGVEVHGIVGDFERHLELLPDPIPGEPRIVAFFGGTLGNFPPGTRRRFLRDLSVLLGPDDHLLLGAGLVTDVSRLEAAYDDSAGVTAEFNRNVLHVLNRELDGNIDADGFDHVAIFDEQNEWIEMRLRARTAQSARIEALDLDLVFEAGEEIRTEISAKFTRDRLQGDYEAAGLALRAWMTDPDELFTLTLAGPA